jgi:cobalamin biosynthesis Co2+ chelatase CbiK
MSKIKEKDIEEIRRAVENEFPDDPALQQVHIARKIIAKEAQLEGLSFFEYIKLLGKRVKNVQ